MATGSHFENCVANDNGVMHSLAELVLCSHWMHVEIRRSASL